MKEADDMINKLVCISVNHKKAPVEVIESVFYKDPAKGMNELRVKSFSDEIVLVQTCNRVEAYIYSRKPRTSGKIIKSLFKNRIKGFKDGEKDEFIALFFGEEAVKHLFKVISSIDSMVIGEQEILGQVNKDYLKAVKAGVTGQHLHIAFKKALAVGKRVRKETGISKKPISLAYAAVDLIKEKNDLTSLNIIVVGAGRTGKLIVSSLKDHNAVNVTILNRTLEKAIKIARKYNYKFASLLDLKSYLRKADLVFVATSAPHYIIKVNELRKVLRERSKGMTLIDLSNPRNVDERISGIPCVELKTIDDLRLIAERNRRERLKEVKKAEKIILEEISSFRREMRKLVARKILKKVFTRAEEIRKRELERAIKIIDFNETNTKVLDAMTKSIINKVLTPVIVKVEKAALNDESEVVEIISEIFSGVRR